MDPLKIQILAYKSTEVGIEIANNLLSKIRFWNNNIIMSICEHN